MLGAMPPDASRPPGARRAAVVANPTKHDDVAMLRDTVRWAMSEHGWDEPLWYETTAADPGTGQAAQAVREGAGLVLACGGDGTVTRCAEALRGTGIPLGILPLGTGNLLARNLGLPLDLDAALVTALTGSNRRLDAGSANGHTFVVMAGLGFALPFSYCLSPPSAVTVVSDAMNATRASLRRARTASSETRAVTTSMASSAATSVAPAANASAATAPAAPWPTRTSA